MVYTLHAVGVHIQYSWCTGSVHKSHFPETITFLMSFASDVILLNLYDMGWYGHIVKVFGLLWNVCLLCDHLDSGLAGDQKH